MATPTRGTAHEQQRYTPPLWAFSTVERDGDIVPEEARQLHAGNGPSLLEQLEHELALYAEAQAHARDVVPELALYAEQAREARQAQQAAMAHQAAREQQRSQQRSIPEYTFSSWSPPPPSSDSRNSSRAAHSPPLDSPPHVPSPPQEPHLYGYATSTTLGTTSGQWASTPHGTLHSLHLATSPPAAESSTRAPVSTSPHEHDASSSSSPPPREQYALEEALAKQRAALSKQDGEISRLRAQLVQERRGPERRPTANVVGAPAPPKPLPPTAGARTHAAAAHPALAATRVATRGHDGTTVEPTTFREDQHREVLHARREPEPASWSESDRARAQDGEIRALREKLHMAQRRLAGHRVQHVVDAELLADAGVDPGAGGPPSKGPPQLVDPLRREPPMEVPSTKGSSKVLVASGRGGRGVAPTTGVLRRTIERQAVEMGELRERLKWTQHKLAAKSSELRLVRQRDANSQHDVQAQLEAEASALRRADADVRAELGQMRAEVATLRAENARLEHEKAELQMANELKTRWFDEHLRMWMPAAAVAGGGHAGGGMGGGHASHGAIVGEMAL